MKLEWFILSEEEAVRTHSPWYGRDLEGEAYRALFIHRCEQAGEHDWYLEIDPYDGVLLRCRTCPAWLNDVYPDGADLLTGEFEVMPGYVLGLRLADVEVNGKPCYGLFTYGWRGPVSVELETVTYTSMDWIGNEYDAWIIVEARHDA